MVVKHGSAGSLEAALREAQFGSAGLEGPLRKVELGSAGNLNFNTCFLFVASCVCSNSVSVPVSKSVSVAVSPSVQAGVEESSVEENEPDRKEYEYGRELPFRGALARTGVRWAMGLRCPYIRSISMAWVVKHQKKRWGSI